MGRILAMADNQKAFGTYQVELSRLWEGVPEREKARLEEVAALWNQMGPPPDQQAKFAFLASSCRQSWIIDVALEMQRRHTSTFGILLQTDEEVLWDGLHGVEFS